MAISEGTFCFCGYPLADGDYPVSIGKNFTDFSLMLLFAYPIFWCRIGNISLQSSFGVLTIV